MSRQRGYERFGLVKNPFQDVTSEQLDEVDLLHVAQPVDEVLQTMKDDVLDKKRKASVVLVGPLGSGKTQRLMVTAREAEDAGALWVYHQMTHEARWIVAGVAEEIRKAADPGSLKRFLSGPKWYADLRALEKKVKRKFDPEQVGKVIAGALNANAPSFLLLNDLQNMEGQKEVDMFMQTLHAVMNNIRPGVMVMMTSYPAFFQTLSKRHPAVVARLDRRLPVKGVNDNEAALLLAKRFLANRLVDDLDPLYPFTESAVARMAHAVQNNPRRLLKLANRVLEAALGTKAFHIDVEHVDTVLADMGASIEDEALRSPAGNAPSRAASSVSPTASASSAHHGPPPARGPAAPAPGRQARVDASRASPPSGPRASPAGRRVPPGSAAPGPRATAGRAAGPSQGRQPARGGQAPPSTSRAGTGTSAGHARSPSGAVQPSPTAARPAPSNSTGAPRRA